MKEIQVKATGGTVTHRQKSVMVKNRKRMQNYFNSKSLMLIKADPLTYLVSINRKLAKKLEIDEHVQIKLFPEVNAIIIGKNLPFPKQP